MKVKSDKEKLKNRRDMPEQITGERHSMLVGKEEEKKKKKKKKKKGANIKGQQTFHVWLYWLNRQDSENCSSSNYLYFYPI